VKGRKRLVKKETNLGSNGHDVANMAMNIQSSPRDSGEPIHHNLPTLAINVKQGGAMW